MKDSLLARLMRYDDTRPSVPGEHWLALAAGLFLLTRGQGATLGRALSIAAGTALVVRAASGRDGIATLLAPKQAALRAAPRRGSWRSPPGRLVDLNGTWPEPQRARISAISQPIGRTSPNH